MKRDSINEQWYLMRLEIAFSLLKNRWKQCLHTHTQTHTHTPAHIHTHARTHANTYPHTLIINNKLF